jgi:hypothetical protein
MARCDAIVSIGLLGRFREIHVIARYLSFGSVAETRSLESMFSIIILSFRLHISRERNETNIGLPKDRQTDRQTDERQTDNERDRDREPKSDEQGGY